jgi:diguanylate cyclase (GGDEF)-like protein/PAS domain S-box-containing protein
MPAVNPSARRHGDRSAPSLWTAVPGICAAVVALVAGLALAGWAVDAHALAGAAPGLPEMKINTALALIAAAAALVLVRDGSPRSARRAGALLGAAVAVFGLVVCGEYVFGGIGVDTLLAADAGSRFPGRPAQQTAILLIVLGAALATVRPLPRVGTALIAAALVGVLFAIVGYLYGVDFLRSGSGRSGVAVNTLACLLALSIGLACLDPERGIVGLLRGDDAGSRMARVLLPVTVGSGLLFGAAGYRLETHTDVSLSLADAVYTLTTVLSLAVVVLLTAAHLRRHDRRIRGLATIVETAQDGIITNLPDGTITSWNAAAERMYGYRAAEIIGRPIGLLAPAELAGEAAGILTRVAGGEAVELETRHVDHAGHTIDVALSVSPIRDATGAVVEASTIVRDITEEKRAAQERRRLAAVVGASADAIMSLDAAGRFTTWNPGAEALFGYSEQEIVGRHVSVLVPEELREEFDSRMATLDTGQPIFGWRTRRRHRDGSDIDVDITVSPLVDETGERSGATAILRDLRERKEAERRFESLLEAAPDGMIIVDEAGVMVQVNAQTEAVFGYRREELLGRPVELLLPLGCRAAHVGLREGYTAAPRARMMRSDDQLAGRAKDGTEIPVEVSLSPFETAGGLLVIAAVRDVSGRRAAERALAASEELFRRSFEDSGTGMALVGLTEAGLGHVLEVNDALAAITGFPRRALRVMAPLAIVHPDDVPALIAEFRSLRSGELPVIRREARLVDAAGNTMWAALAVSMVRDADGKPIHAVIQVQDVSERKHFEGQLQHLADHDALTGLFNRRRFEQELVRELAQSKRYAASGCVLVLDLDNFKLVNDTLGHAAGDELITIVGELLRRRLRESDVLSRMGGDEFAVILPHTDAERSRQIGESLLRELREDTRASDVIGGRRVTASIGVAPFVPDDEELTADDLLAQADIAMYDAKENGRDRVAVYDVAGARHHRMQARVTWSNRIVIALERGRFAIHAQPVVPLGVPEHGRRYELLLRMIGENGDLIPPGAFLPVAERSDLAQRIDRWVVARATALLAQQLRLGRDVAFSVNLSAKSVNDPEMLAHIKSAIDRAGIDPGRLTFEVTETAAIVNVPRATEFAQRLREIGCALALDDFGAGFASFYYLKHLSFDFLKIDGEFIKDLSTDRTNQLVVRSVVDIAHGMGKRTIAECVGDDATIALLREYGVDYAQGYHLGRPQPFELALEAPAADRESDEPEGAVYG